MSDRLSDHERRILHLEQWKNGNGAKGAEERLQMLEEKENSQKCEAGIRLDKHIKYHREQEEKQVDAKQWAEEMRISRRNNLIGFIAIGVTIIIAVIFGG